MEQYPERLSNVGQNLCIHTTAGPTSFRFLTITDKSTTEARLNGGKRHFCDSGRIIRSLINSSCYCYAIIIDILLLINVKKT